VNADGKLVRLFHGTSATQAHSISELGFTPAVHFDEELSRVACEFGFGVAEIRSTLENMSQFSVIQEGRDRSVWFTPHWETGWDWASRSPELRYEALSAVWLLRNGMGDDPFQDPNGWYNNPQCCAFVLRGFWDDDPAVVEVQVPLGFLSDQDQDLAGDEYWAERPEVRIDQIPGPEFVVSFEVRSRRVSLCAAAGLLNVTQEELEKMVEREEILRPAPPGTLGAPWSWSWCLEDFYVLTGIGPERLLNVNGSSSPDGND
jgi:hypothetical protein